MGERATGERRRRATPSGAARPRSAPPPARRRRAGAGGAGIRQRAGGLTTRAAILALVVCVLSLSLAYPLREYLAQRHDIASVEAQVAQQQADLAAARTAYARWRDPAYVRAQAKARLHMVDPGERQYVVVQSNGTTAGKPAATPGASPAPTLGSKRAAARNGAWFGALLSSLHEADTQGSAQGRE